MGGGEMVRLPFNDTGSYGYATQMVLAVVVTLLIVSLHMNAANRVENHHSITPVLRNRYPLSAIWNNRSRHYDPRS